MSRFAKSFLYKSGGSSSGEYDANGEDIILDEDGDTRLHSPSDDVIQLRLNDGRVVEIDGSRMRLDGIDLQSTTNADNIGTDAKRFGVFARGVDTSGELNHSGSTAGFYGATPTTQPSALTAADSSTVDGTYGTEEQNVIENLRTRVNELESKLQALGLLA